MLRRRLLGVLSLFFLILCIATTGMLVTSYVIPHNAVPQAVHVHAFSIDEGQEFWFLTPGALERWMFTPWDGKWYFESATRLWVPAVFLLVVSVATRLASRRLPIPLHVTSFGHCPVCDYDVRATPGRCSECGWRSAERDAK